MSFAVITERDLTPATLTSLNSREKQAFFCMVEYSNTAYSLRSQRNTKAKKQHIGGTKLCQML